ncbi:oligosaccharide flippase family protein [Nanoarchaeota archaeon]
MKYQRISWQIAISYLNLALTLLLGPLLIASLTRGLSISEYGVYAIFSATIATLVVILDFGLSQYIVTKLSGINSKKRLNTFYSLLTFLFFSILLLFLLITLTPIDSLFLKILNLSQYHSEFTLILLMIVIGVQIRVINSYLNSKKQIEYQNFITFIDRSLWMIIVIIYFFIVGQLTLYNVILIWLIGKLVALSIFLIGAWKEIFTFISKRKFSNIYEGLKFGVPLIPSLVGIWIILIGDRYILTFLEGTQSVGFYAFAFSIASIILTLGVVISEVLFPYISERFHKKGNFMILFNASIKYSMMIILPAAAGIFAMKEEIITMVSGPAYLNSAPLIIWLIPYVLLAFFTHIFYQNMLLRSRTILLGTIFAMGALINIPLNLFLIPKFSLVGAALATVLTYSFMFLILYLYSRKQLFLDYSFIKIERILISTIIMAFLVYILNPTTIITKLLVISLGAIIYGSLVLLFKIFSKKEIVLIKSLPKKVFTRIYDYYNAAK